MPDVSPPPRHPTSLAVWGVPVPVVVDRPFTVWVGVTCAESCRLADLTVVVRDEADRPIGEGRLGVTPRPGTRALYGVEVTLTAPTSEGTHAWTARLPESPPRTSSDPAHAGAEASFSFRTVPPPDHTVTVNVTDRATGAPLADVHVRLGPYPATSDAAGAARLEVPTGTYGLSLWKAGYALPEQTVEIRDSTTLRVSADAEVDDETDDGQVWM